MKLTSYYAEVSSNKVNRQLIWLEGMYGSSKNKPKKHTVMEVFTEGSLRDKHLALLFNHTYYRFAPYNKGVGR